MPIQKFPERKVGTFLALPFLFPRLIEVPFYKVQPFVKESDPPGKRKNSDENGQAGENDDGKGSKSPISVNRKIAEYVVPGPSRCERLIRKFQDFP